MTGTSVSTSPPARKNARPRQAGQLSLFPGRAAAAGGRKSARDALSFSPPPASPAVLPAAAALGNPGEICTRFGPADVVRLQRRSRRRLLRDVNWHKSSLRGPRLCGRFPIGGGGDIALVGNGGIAHYRGLVTCGSIWACPVCSAKIRAARAVEIAEAAANWHRAGNTVLMVTLTMPHDFGMRLAALLPVVAEGFTSVIAGAPWQRLKKRVPVAGQIRSIEVTHGPSGWHPHAHCCLFITGQVDAVQLAAVGAHVRSRWRRFITGKGYRPPSELHGVKIDVCTSAAEAGAYIAKTQDGKSPGNEMARADLKPGREGRRAPFEILGGIADTGDLADLPIWHEYEKATKGRQAITWSAGLDVLVFGCKRKQRTDAELAAEEVGGDLVMEFSGQAWRQVTRVLGLEVRLLEAWENGGGAAVIALAAAHGLVEDPAPPGPVPRLIRGLAE